ncbi:GlxA family transcriptional regulator [Nocardiopsis halophila]|uniref:GlxA family transcriptional regulator n=1 Tax=Nocardiopsis halophila TaxID=141692 RepID=UPI001F4C9F7A|nr:helix-turn-helix domain-containing protein [Nocardiopsis halophila]
MERTPRKRARHTVAVLVRDGALPMETGIVHRIFGEARSPQGGRLYDVLTCAVRPGEVRTDADFTINVARGPEALAAADTVVVPASDVDYEPVGGPLEGELAQAFARIPPGARYASICTGTFVLAAAGLLDGLRATTHWRSAARLAELYPAVRVEPDVLYTDEGDVLTAAGVASGIDLCLHMVRRDHGAAVAAEVARGTVVPPHRDGGQAQYIRRPVPPSARGGATAVARAWAEEDLSRPMPLAELAGRASMSVRTFTRRFREETGVSPARWLHRQRVDYARRLLEESDLAVDRVAERSGLGTAASLRAHIKAETGVSPTEYRRTFRGATAHR